LRPKFPFDFPFDDCHENSRFNRKEFPDDCHEHRPTDDVPAKLVLRAEVSYRSTDFKDFHFAVRISRLCWVRETVMNQEPAARGENPPSFSQISKSSYREEIRSEKIERKRNGNARSST
jgi:hypothetical protein